VKHIPFDFREIARLRAEGKLDPIALRNLESLFHTLIEKVAQQGYADLTDGEALLEAQNIQKMFYESGIPIVSADMPDAERRAIVDDQLLAIVSQAAELRPPQRRTKKAMDDRLRQRVMEMRAAGIPARDMCEHLDRERYHTPAKWGGISWRAAFKDNHQRVETTLSRLK